MTLRERVASTLVGTPLQPIAEQVRWILQYPYRRSKPELAEFFLESSHSHAMMHERIKPGMACVDVGGHLGSVAAKMMRLSKRNDVTIIEALPYKAAWLRRKFPEAIVHECAISDHDGETTFYLSVGSTGFSGMRGHGSGEKQELKVPMRTLDSVAPQGVGFIKIDVEGAEYLVFQGASRVLSVDRPVLLFECTFSGRKAYNVAASDVWNLLDGHRYDVFVPGSPQPLTAEEFEKAQVWPFRTFNFHAFPRA